MPSEHKVFITGTGITSALGVGLENTWAAVNQKKTGILAIRSDYTDKKTLAAKIDFVDGSDRLFDISELALAEAISNADLSKEDVESSAFIFANGSPNNAYITSQFSKLQDKGRVHPNTVYKTMNNYTCSKLASAFSIRGSVISNAAACAGSAQAIHLGYQLVKYGVIDRCICGGGDVIDSLTIEGFRSMRFVLSQGSQPSAIQPFGAHRNGIALGEAVGFVVLESGKCLERIDSNSVIEINNSVLKNEPTSKYGEMDSPLVWKNIIKETLLEDPVSLVVSHATSTKNGDFLEACGIIQAIPQTHTTSLKYYFGHTLSASTVIDIIMLKEMMLRKVALGPGHQYAVDNDIKDLKLLTSSIDTRIDSALKLSAGFGGSVSGISLSTFM